MSNALLDVTLCYQFLKRLASPFKDWDAFKSGVIDKDGNILIKDNMRSLKQKESFRPFDVMVLKIKKIIESFPLGKTKLASYIAALWFLKEWKDEMDENIIFESFNEFYKELNEDGEGSVGPANVTGANVSTDQPVVNKENQKNWLHCLSLTDDGFILGGHLCSDMVYMMHDLHNRPDRLAKVQNHFKHERYDIEVLSFEECKNHIEFNKAIELANKKEQKFEGAEISFEFSE